MPALPAGPANPLALFWRTPLSAPATFVGTVDGSRDRGTPTPRTLEQAFGRDAYSGVIVPMGSDAPMHPSDLLVTRCSAVIGACLLVGLLVELLFF